MADFNHAFEVLKHLEFKDCSDALHWNEGEQGWTFMGIYQNAHPNSKIWKELEKYQEIEKDPKKLSRLLCNNITAMQEVKNIYRMKYWNRAKLYDVKSQKKAEEIFVFGVNVGIENAIKKAQELVGVKADGIVGPKTLKALNEYDKDLFDAGYDFEEIKYYKELINKNPKFAKYEKGWVNRAKAV
ncbi:glycoside hydrolase family 108 protein [Nitrosophilus kaiyonis]|uniref:glycoside hydrolase family 108 protein n=1 Tax=Nitrosophilus kaiyonis TaxID=2930200 RepID=UPI00249343D1|nr:putative peptidoglycan-binding domain-containing protein [Nitrosophilus kaiyonis]